jgi:hypothetical protein
MAQTIQAIFVDPPIAIARLGGSGTPQDSYVWVDPDNPRSDGNTVVAPCWTLDVKNDGSIEPRMPNSVVFRDDGLIRPVAPFFEIWASLGEPGSPPSRWQDVPLTPTLLREFRLDETALSLQFDAHNRKAARRRVDENLGFGTFPPVTVRADDHDVHALPATSPPGAAIPMIPAGRHIPLGSVQVMRSRRQPSSSDRAPWRDFVNLEVIRFRLTPAPGQFYGPPQAAVKTERRDFAAVLKANAFLDPKAGWYDESTKPTVEPSDTYDALVDSDGTGPSLGVVDDTCEVRATITLTLPGKPLVAHANIFVGPPDFAPDRRPFLSLADELGDRGSASEARNSAMSKQDRETWVEDLFERIYETVSLFNVDFFQTWRGIQLQGDRLLPPGDAIAGDGIVEPKDHAMTNRDALRNDAYVIPARSDKVHLPLSEHARTRHKAMQDIDGLVELIGEHPDRLKQLIRQPFEVEARETNQRSTMRMPPFMRHSNAFPLTLSAWQYELLMRWVDSVRSPAKKSRAAALRAAAPKLSPDAKRRRDAILAWLDQQEYKS